jgi:hypothetical protein
LLTGCILFQITQTRHSLIHQGKVEEEGKPGFAFFFKLWLLSCITKCTGPSNGKLQSLNHRSIVEIEPLHLVVQGFLSLEVSNAHHGLHKIACKAWNDFRLPSSLNNMM